MAKSGGEGYTRYPARLVLLYNGTTMLHFALGGAGIMLAYQMSWGAAMAGAFYLVLAFGQMYLMMPLVVCPNCVYYRLEGSLCVSGLNRVSRRIAGQGRIEDFGNRARGLLCHNNFYIGALAVPVVAIIPGLVLSFSWVVMGILLAVAALLVFRMFYMVPRMVCPHCRARRICPNARSMGLS